MESDAEAEVDVPSYFQNCYVGIEKIEDSVRNSITEATLSFSKGEIDAMVQAASRAQLADLNCNTRNLVACCTNLDEYSRAKDEEKVALELQKQIEIEGKIATTLKSIPNVRVRECVAHSLSFLSEAFATTLGAAKRVIRNVKEKLAKIFKSIGHVAASCFAIGGVITTVATGSLVALGLTVVGIAVVALVIYKKCKAKAKPDEN